ncbi:RidA family protein [Micromonospora sp. LZ34]
MSRFEHFGFGVPWEDAANYSQAVRAGNLLFISGQLSHDMGGTFRHEGDFAAQAAATFDNLDAVLRRFDAQRADIAEINAFVVDLPVNFEAFGAACRHYFGDHRPASNVFGVTALAFPPQLIEVAATAVLAS